MEDEKDRTAKMMRFTFGPLDPKAHDRKNFSCGKEPLDIYLRAQASQDLERNYVTCWVAATAEGRIAGYFTLTAHCIPLENLPEAFRKGLPSRIPVPAALLGRLAVAQQFKGQGLGEILITYALTTAARSGNAAHMLVVDALDENAAAFYRHLGFHGFPSAPTRFFMPLAYFRAE
ncbi:GNAT family N-acetyltransferase [Mesoterricola silvestris]|uniref:GNAT family N-acetyltransferase n=1 Tax=Mesoterricola silvestris TaxID=2927979 RepID=UPI0029311580|nr:GNAT family N-acetyltransferase [Mesoterricola silvestris]